MKKNRCRTHGISRVISISAIILPVFLVSLQCPTFAAELVRVKVKLANVRTGPGINYKKKWTAPRNYPYRVLKRTRGWIQVRDYEGFRDWIHKKLTDKKPAIIVNTKSANIYKGPGKKQPILFTSDRGVPYRVLSRQGKWLKIRHSDGDEGWILRTQVWGAVKAKTKL